MDERDGRPRETSVRVQLRREAEPLRGRQGGQATAVGRVGQRDQPPLQRLRVVVLEQAGHDQLPALGHDAQGAVPHPVDQRDQARRRDVEEQQHGDGLEGQEDHVGPEEVVTQEEDERTEQDAADRGHAAQDGQEEQVDAALRIEGLEVHPALLRGEDRPGQPGQAARQGECLQLGPGGGHTEALQVGLVLPHRDQDPPEPRPPEAAR